MQQSQFSSLNFRNADPSVAVRYSSPISWIFAIVLSVAIWAILEWTLGNVRIEADQPRLARGSSRLAAAHLSVVRLRRNRLWQS